jgi:hypothetical protein
MRKLGAAFLFMVAVAFLVFAGLMLGGLTEYTGQQDNPDSVYITGPAVMAFSGLVFAALGVWLLRGS